MTNLNQKKAEQTDFIAETGYDAITVIFTRLKREGALYPNKSASPAGCQYEILFHFMLEYAMEAVGNPELAEYEAASKIAFFEYKGRYVQLISNGTYICFQEPSEETAARLNHTALGVYAIPFTDFMRSVKRHASRSKIISK
ncbi:hypothetical protein [Bacillus nakamurai]|uniref:hypothetical protein n=1 Tax=Bacillus nakamurai TaxID=1793963 RepID=UPI001E2C957F|nr:hypothetical protein [Bacillus nakamurai]MCC9024456.1 hypothetical protein [Bacillus nakamurai]MCP6684195.1 hypothetical protein [Bacillus nakamurai]